MVRKNKDYSRKFTIIPIADKDSKNMKFLKGYQTLQQLLQKAWHCDFISAAVIRSGAAEEKKLLFTEPVTMKKMGIVY